MEERSEPGRSGWFRRQLASMSPGKDVPAGLVLGVESVPDGLAGGLLAGVNPIYGLYGYLFGTLFGALATSSVFMAVQATGAMAVVISDVSQVQPSQPDADTALFTLTVLTGVVMLALGVARMGWITRWVPNSVLTGFINAVAINIVLGQLDSLSGYESVGGNRVIRAADTATSIGSWSAVAVAVGVVTIVLILLLERTPLGALGMVVAIAIASAIVPLLGLDVAQLRSITEIPGSLPTPGLPSLSLVVELIVPAVSLAFVGLVQGAAISSSVPNPDGRYPDASGDFRGQGIANIGTGLFQGMPVGGSMSATSIVTSAGARSRLALVVAALTMMVSILVFSDLVGYIAMPALAGLLIVVGFRALRPDDAVMVWRTGMAQASVMGVTFVLTMVIPLQYAVLVGIGLSIVLYVFQQSNQVVVKRWSITDDGAVTEDDAPATLGAGEVVVLRPYGSLFFASAPLFESALPEPTASSRHAVVIITLRGKENLGSTFINVVTRYAANLAEHDCILMISGTSPRVTEQLESTNAVAVIGSGNVYPLTPVLGASTRTAMADAHRWIAEHEHPEEP